MVMSPPRTRAMTRAPDKLRPVPVVPRAVEAREDVGQVGLGDAHALVPHHDDHAVVVGDDHGRDGLGRRILDGVWRQ